MDQFQSRFKAYFTFHPVTTVILIINTLMALLVLFSGGFTLDNLISWGGLVPPLVTELGHYYRILTAMALHGSILHVLMNCYVLYYIGGHLERLIGPKRYAVVYLASGILSSLFVVFFGQPNVVTVGASGAIFGVMGFLLILTFRKPTWFPPSIAKSIRNLTLLNLVITFLIPNISILGHLGGVIGGALLALMLTPDEPDYLKRFIVENNERYYQA
jgi:rhomboid protease GluP